MVGPLVRMLILYSISVHSKPAEVDSYFLQNCLIRTLKYASKSPGLDEYQNICSTQLTNKSVVELTFDALQS